MPTIARLALRRAPDALDDLLGALDTHLAPILTRHGLPSPQPNPRTPIPGVHSLLYPASSPAAVRAASRALAADPDWQAQVARHNLRWSLGLFSTPAGPGHPVPAGPGTRRGLWHSYSLPDGLLSPVLNDLLQDRHGHIWMSTGDGVSCFDGSQFRHWTAADGLPHSTICALAEDRDGHLWFASGGYFVFARHGLCRYDGTTFEHFTAADGLPSDAIHALLTTSDGRLWVFTPEGPAVFCGDHFEVPPLTQGPLPQLVFRAYEHADGRIWVCTTDGLCTYEQGGFHWLPPEDGGPKGLIWSCVRDRHGRFWAGGPDGLFVRDGDGSFAQHPIDHLLATPGAGPLLEDPEGGLWCSAFPSGVLRLAEADDRAYAMDDGLPGNRAAHAIVDQDGRLWLSYNGGGLARYDGDRLAHITTRDGLLHDGCYFMRRDRHGHLWVGTDKGVSRYDGSAWTAAIPTATWSPAFIDLLEEPDGTLWGVTHAGRVHRRAGSEWEQLLDRPPSTFNNGALALDWQGGIWCANGAEGVHRYSDGAWTTYTPDDHGVPPGQARALAIDHAAQRVWVGTTLGAVGYWDGTAFTITSDGADWDDRCILHLFVDRDSRLWVGTEGAGVACWDGEDLRIYTTAHGLGGDRVLRVGQDRSGTMLLGTQGGGVSFFDGEIIQTLSVRDGLSSDVVKDFLQDEDGAYWFVTQKGLTHYRPSERHPKVGLTEVIADQTYPSAAPDSPDGPPHTPASGGSAPATPLTIPVSQHFVRCTFQGSSYTTRPDGFVYRYRLVGRDPDWRLTRQQQVTYEHLPLGTYTLEVQAADADLLRSEIASLTIEIVPDPRDQALTEALRLTAPSGQLIGRSPAAMQLHHRLQQVADTDATVLLTGETGTGKGLAARCIHDLSPRCRAPFVQVNCGAIPLNLIESELFGHERGAFTGAHARKLGKVELAAGGTLFLDEIGEMGPEAQIRLLRLLEERMYERLGGTDTLTADVRVIAATHRDIQQLVDDGSFRQDLYFRLNVFPIALPPLRERRDDIELLATHFLADLAEPNQAPPTLTPAAAAALRDYAWPGNIREVRNVMERAAILCHEGVIEPADLALPGTTAHQPPGASPRPTLAQHEREYLVQVLEEANWVIAGPRGAAQALDMPESTLRGRMATLGIKRPDQR